MLKIRKTLIWSAYLNIVEWYDFTIYGILSPVLAKLFFPTQQITKGLLFVFLIFAAGFIARPLGGILFGYVGDKKGRKKAIIISFMLITLSTGLIGLLPTYGKIGVLSPFLLLVLRIVQGLSVGGEFVGTLILTGETAKKNKISFSQSFVFLGVLLGILIGSVFGSFVSGIFHNSLYKWGWRTPFLFSFIVGGVGFYFRHKAEESKYQAVCVENPFAKIIKNHLKPLLYLISVFGASSIVFYATFIYIPSNGSVLMKSMSVSMTLLINAASVFLIILLTPIIGILSDHFSEYKILRFGMCGFILLVYPAFFMLKYNLFTYILAQGVLAILTGFIIVPIPKIALKIFPLKERFSGMGAAINFSVGIFGGTAPFILAAITNYYKGITHASFYIVFILFISLFSLRKLFFLEKTRVV